MQEENIARLRKAALNTSHQLSRCQVIFTKIFHYNYYCHYCQYYYYHNFSFWDVTIWFFLVLLQFEYLSFIIIWFFWFLHTFFFFFFLLTVWVFEFCPNLSFVTYWFCELGHSLRFWVLSQFEFMSFVTIWGFEFCHKLSFKVLSQFDLLSFVTV